MDIERSKLYQMINTEDGGVAVVWGTDYIFRVCVEDDPRESYDMAWEFMIAHAARQKTLGEMQYYV